MATNKKNYVYGAVIMAFENSPGSLDKCRSTGIGDRSPGGMCPPNFREIFGGQMSLKNCAFFGKYHVKFGHFGQMSGKIRNFFGQLSCKIRAFC